MARLEGGGIRVLLGDLMSIARRVIAELGGVPSLRHGATQREDWLFRILLVPLLAALGFLGRDLRGAGNPASALAPLGLAVFFLVAGAWGWREWRGRPAGRAHLLLGGTGALAALVLARAWAGGDPGRAWFLAWFLLPPALVEATVLTVHANGARSLSMAGRGLLYGVPLLLYSALIFAGSASRMAHPYEAVAAGLLGAGLFIGLVRGVSSLRASRAIDARQRGKLIAAGEGFAFAALLATVAARVTGSFPGGAPLLGMTLAPAALCAAAVEGDLLWVDRILRRALAGCLAVPPVAFLAALAVRIGGAAGAALATLLVLAAPLGWWRLGGAVERLTLRSRARRLAALDALAIRLPEATTPEEVAVAVSTVYREAFPGVSASLIIAEPRSGRFVEAAPPREGAPRRSLQPDHPLAVHLRSTVVPLTRYDILAGSRFDQNRGARLSEIDALHAAALIPCRDGEALRAILLLGGEVRGGFFTEDEIRDADGAASPVGPSLSHTIALSLASAQITRLERALESARADAGRIREEESRTMEDLEESTRHVMAAYTELKVRGMAAKEMRTRLAASAGIILAGRVLESAAGDITAALAGGPARRHAKAGEQNQGARRARLALAAISAVARKDSETPARLAEAIEGALAALAGGWRGRISVDSKIEQVPDVAWPIGALQAALFALLVNAAEGIKKRGTITISGRAIKGHVLTIADAEVASDGEGLAVGHTPGQLAWISGAPRVALTISDNGVGIAPEDQKTLFTPFQTTKPARPGVLGLGLSMVADALATHGGSIRVDSDPGRGSSFILELPGALPAGRPGSAKSRS